MCVVLSYWCIRMRTDHCCSHYLPSNRHHRSNGDCLEVWRIRGKITGSVLCNIVCNSCTQCNAHTYEQTNSSLDWILSHWAHFTVLRFIFVYVLFCVSLYVACMCSHGFYGSTNCCISQWPNQWGRANFDPPPTPTAPKPLNQF